MQPTLTLKLRLLVLAWVSFKLQSFKTPKIFITWTPDPLTSNFLKRERSFSSKNILNSAFIFRNYLL